MNLTKFAMYALAGTMAFGLTACLDDSGTNSGSIGGGGSSLSGRDNGGDNGGDNGRDNTPSTVGPNGVDYKNSRSYRDYTDELTSGSQKYLVVRIGSQLWMGSNLNDPSAGHCYKDDEEYCDRFGRLYSWAEAMNISDVYNYEDASLKIKNKHQGICPDGWRLPTETDFEKLKDFIRYDYDHDDIALDNGFGESDDISGIQLKSTNFDINDDLLWTSKDGIAGEDTYGFYAVGTGYADANEGEDDYGDPIVTYSYQDLGENSYFWTATQHDDYDQKGAEAYGFDYDRSYLNHTWEWKDQLHPVRCMKDL